MKMKNLKIQKLMICVFVLMGVVFGMRGVVYAQTIDTIMADCKLVEYIATNATVDVNSIINDTSFSATLQGEFAVWEKGFKSFYDCTDTPPDYQTCAVCSKQKCPPSTVTLKFAINSKGDFYLGAKGPDADVLSVLVKGEYDSPAGIGSPGRVWLHGLSVKQNSLTYIMKEIWLKQIKFKRYAYGGPENEDELLYNSYFSLNNKYTKPIYIVFAGMVHEQVNGGWWQINVHPRWSPATTVTGTKTLERHFELSYIGQSASYIDIGVSCDNGNWSEEYLDGTRVVRQENSSSLTYATVNKFPISVDMKSYTVWSWIGNRFWGAFLADNINVTNWYEKENGVLNPTNSFDKNPKPEVLKLNIGINGTGTTGIVSGKITKQDGVTPVHRAKIEAYQNNILKARAVSNADGNYEMKLLAGTYNFIVTADGYSSSAKDNIIVSEASTTSLNFQIQELPGATIVETVLFTDDCSGTITDKWILKGSPQPYYYSTGNPGPSLFPNGDASWDSAALTKINLDRTKGDIVIEFDYKRDDTTFWGGKASLGNWLGNDTQGGTEMKYGISWANGKRYFYIAEQKVMEEPYTAGVWEKYKIRIYKAGGAAFWVNNILKLDAGMETATNNLPFALATHAYTQLFDNIKITQYVEQRTVGTLSGKVTKEDGITPISGAVIEVLQNDVVKASIITDTNGNYSILLAEGTYDVKCQKPEYEPQTKSAIVTTGQTTTVNFLLSTLTLPSAPTNLTATGGDTQVTLSWTASTKGTYDIAGYNIYRSTTQGSGYAKINQQPVTNTQYTDTSVSNGTKYYYVVRAVDTQNNESANSNEVSATPYAPSLVAYWKFDEGTGNIASDSSGNGNNGTIYGATWTQGVSGGALSFDGVDDYVEIPNSPTLNPQHITVSAWIKPLDITSERYKEIVRKDDSGGGASYILSFQEYGTQLTFGVNAPYPDINETNTSIIPTYFTDGKFHHIAGTFDGSIIKLYIDGVLKGILNYTGLIEPSTTPVMIGKWRMGNAEHFNGLIDEVKIYNYARSAEEILADYQAVLIPPSAPTNLTATGGDTQVTLSWTASTKGTYDIAGYNIYRSTTQGSGYAKINQQPVTNTQYTDTSVSNGTKYYYVVRAVDTKGNESANSNEVSATPQDTTPPSAITNLTATNPTSNSITLTWTATGDDGNTGTATSYDIRYSTTQITESNWANATKVTNPPTPKPAGSSETFVVTGLSPDTTYYFAIKVSDEVPNWSGLSNVASAKTTFVLPSAPTNLTATAGDTKIDLSWTASTAGTYPIAGYNVYRSTTQGSGYAKINQQPVTNTQYTDTSVSNGTKYYYVVRAIDTQGNESANSNEVSATPQDTTPPSAITNLQAGNPTSNSITLTWTAVGDDGNTGTATSYDIRYSTTQITESNWANATKVTNPPTPKPAGSSETFVVTGLSPDTTYYFAIKVSDEVPNWSGLSNVASAKTTFVLPSAPTNLTATAGDTKVDLSWTASQKGTYDIAGYNVYRSTTQGSGYAKINQQPVTNTQYTDTSVSNGTKYYYVVRAVDTKGNESANSNEVSATPQDTTPPSAITNLTATNPTTNSITLTWTATGDDGNTGTAASYDIRYSTTQITESNWTNATKVSGVPQPKVAGSSETFVVTGLNPGTTYYFAIKVADEVPNISTLSNVASATTTISLQLYSNYNLISLPVVPKNATNPELALGIPNLKIAKWNELTQTYEQDNITLEVGKGYWVKLSQGTNIQITPDSYPQADADGYYHIALKPGWNFIGNPWNFKVNLSDLKVLYNAQTYTLADADNSLLVGNYAWGYDAQNQKFSLVHPTLSQYLNYNIAKTIDNWKGYEIHSDKECELLIPNIPAAKVKEEIIPISENNWNVRITAKVENKEDEIFVGINNELSKIMIPKPKNISPYVEVKTEKGLLDFKPIAYSLQPIVFEFEVETDIVNTDVTISIDTSNLPEGYRIKLVDVANSQKPIANSNYIYNSGNGGVRKFKLIVEKPLIDTQEKALSLEYTYAYPNPYSGKRTEVTPAGKLRYTADSLTFRYKATGDIKKVVIEIYNIKGKLIDRFEDTTIDGEANYDFAEKLANGVYIYRITISDGKKNVSKRGKIVILR